MKQTAAEFYRHFAHLPLTCRTAFRLTAVAVLALLFFSCNSGDVKLISIELTCEKAFTYVTEDCGQVFTDEYNSAIPLETLISRCESGNDYYYRLRKCFSKTFDDCLEMTACLSRVSDDDDDDSSEPTYTDVDYFMFDYCSPAFFEEGKPM